MDIVFASFIRKASDVQDIRAELGEKAKHIKIVSKVCYRAGNNSRTVVIFPKVEMLTAWGV